MVELGRLELPRSYDPQLLKMLQAHAPVHFYRGFSRLRSLRSEPSLLLNGRESNCSERPAANRTSQVAPNVRLERSVAGATGFEPEMRESKSHELGLYSIPRSWQGAWASNPPQSALEADSPAKEHGPL